MRVELNVPESVTEPRMWVQHVANLVALFAVLVSLSTLLISTRKDRRLRRLNMRIRFEALQQF